VFFFLFKQRTRLKPVNKARQPLGRPRVAPGWLSGLDAAGLVIANTCADIFFLYFFFIKAPCKVGVYACDPAAGSITHKASGWVINPKGFSWKDCEFSIESNHSTMAAKLKNHTMGNSTSIFFPFPHGWS
jgi:hypothetical protein